MTPSQKDLLKNWEKEFYKKYFPFDNGDGTYHRSTYMFTSGGFGRDVMKFIEDIIAAKDAERLESLKCQKSQQPKT